MRILLASDRLAMPGGSETYLITLATHLQRLGHDVHLMEGPGGQGTLASDAGLAVVSNARELDGPPDRAIVQDAIVAGEVAASWPEVPQLFVVHSGIHDLQLPGALPPSVGQLVALNDRVASLSRALAEGRPVHRLRQPVDVGHFTPGPPPRSHPRRVLLFGNNRAQWRAAPLLETCAERGIEVVRVGAAAGNLVSDPVLALRSADIVIGYGRCVLEAMACGRTAFVFDRFGSDGWMRKETYPALEASGFAGRADLDEPGRRNWAEVLDAYDPTDGDVGHDLALRHHSARTHAVEVLELLHDMGPVARSEPGSAFALARTWREQWRWERRALEWASELDDARSALWENEERTRRLSAQVEQLEGELRSLQAISADVDARRRAAEGELAAVRRSRSYRVSAAAARALRLGGRR